MLERVGGAELTRPCRGCVGQGRVPRQRREPTRAACSVSIRPTSSEAIVDPRLLPTRSGSMTNTPFSPAVCTAPSLSRANNHRSASPRGRRRVAAEPRGPSPGTARRRTRRRRRRSPTSQYPAVGARDPGDRRREADAAGGAVRSRRRRTRRCRRRTRRASSRCRSGGGDADDRSVEMHRAGRALEAGVAEGEDAAVGCGEPVAVARRCGGDADDRVG